MQKHIEGDEVAGVTYYFIIIKIVHEVQHGYRSKVHVYKNIYKIE